MSDFVVIRNLKSPIADVTITGDVPEENVDYNLMVDVSLSEVREKKSTGEETPDKTYIFMPTGPIRLINLQKVNERIATGPIGYLGNIGGPGTDPDTV